ncbi:hypothetical protein Q9295_16320 [Xinfangfangia sp. CPCC 101601]|uniref:Dienelactone hydrolase domain-containing protein n=1 Tax=Pseudogemmobacter lacusdianii TaxID=3069608 RepID=A0ABU0W1P1_9RHOB|nr:hypothetical protein [Xinfangfangia sp. CPCC 101601]MDQ2067940.1 hypothetical protein [Xinfangfangia sp. CPCC 101601]
MSDVHTPPPLIALWPGAEVVFDRAWLSLPDGRAGELSDLALDPAALADLPLVIFQTGSTDRGQDKAVAQWFNGLGLAFLAPRSHLVPNRISYQSPAPMEVYQRVHDLRRKEIDYCLYRLQKAGLFDLDRLAVIGLSEGAVAAATWRPQRNCPRVILAWSMEDSYFGRDMTFPHDINCPILNVIGAKDPFFGAQGSLASTDQVIGHGAEVLADYPNTKVILYPNCGHRVADDPQCEADVVNFVVQHLAPAGLCRPKNPQQRTA